MSHEQGPGNSGRPRINLHHTFRFSPEWSAVMRAVGRGTEHKVEKTPEIIHLYPVKRINDRTAHLESAEPIKIESGSKLTFMPIDPASIEIDFFEIEGPKIDFKEYTFIDISKDSMDAIPAGKGSLCIITREQLDLLLSS